MTSDDSYDKIAYVMDVYGDVIFYNPNSLPARLEQQQNVLPSGNTCKGACMRNRHGTAIVTVASGFVIAIVGAVLCIAKNAKDPDGSLTIGIIFALSGVALVILGVLFAGVAEVYVRRVAFEARRALEANPPPPQQQQQQQQQQVFPSLGLSDGENDF